MRLLELGMPQGRVLSFDGVGIAGWFGMLVTSLNLFPVGQLDGGHAAYAVSALTVRCRAGPSSR